MRRIILNLIAVLAVFSLFPIFSSALASSQPIYSCNNSTRSGTIFWNYTDVGQNHLALSCGKLRSDNQFIFLYYNDNIYNSKTHVWHIVGLCDFTSGHSIFGYKLTDGYITEAYFNVS